MEYCRLIDYSARRDCLIELHSFDCASPDTVRSARSVVPSSHFWKVEMGDRIVSFIIDNRIEGIQGLLAIWLNKGVACLDNGEGQVWGDWMADEKLILTYEFEEVLDLQGTTSIGRITYNTHGIRGKYEGGRFYTLFRCDGPIKHEVQREKRHGMS